MSNESYQGWAIVEQMGFNRTVGVVREVEYVGTKMLRLDVPKFDSDYNVVEGEFSETRYCGGPSIYQITPVSPDRGLAEAKRAAGYYPRPAPLMLSAQIAETVDDDGPYSDEDRDQEHG